MKPFDLEKALAGEPIKHLKTEQKAYIIGESKSAKYKKDCYVVQVENLNEEDEVLLTVEYISSLKINYVMWEELRPTVTLTLPCPLKEPQKKNMWYIDAYGEVLESTYIESNENSYWHKGLERGRYFVTKEDAQTWVDAMKDNRK